MQWFADHPDDEFLVMEGSDEDWRVVPLDTPESDPDERQRRRQILEGLGFRLLVVCQRYTAPDPSDAVSRIESKRWEDYVNLFEIESEFLNWKQEAIAEQKAIADGGDWYACDAYPVHHSVEIDDAEAFAMVVEDRSPGRSYILPGCRHISDHEFWDIHYPEEVADTDDGEVISIGLDRLLLDYSRPNWFQIAQGSEQKAAALPEMSDTATKPVKTSAFTFHGDAETPPPPALVKTLLPMHGIAFLGGQSGAGKTFVAVDLAVALASGQPFFEQKVRERVGVVILAAEGFSTLGSRIRVACEARALTDDVLPIAWADISLDLSKPADLVKAIAQLRQAEARFQAQHGCRLGVVVVDTMAAAFSMKDENSAAEAASIIRHMKLMADQLGGLVLAVHHYGKTPDAGLRGSSAWRAGVDAVLSVQADRNELSGRSSNHQIVVTKSRIGPEGWVKPFTLRFVQTGMDEDGEPMGSCFIADADRAEVTINGVKPLRGVKKAYHGALCNVLAAKGVALHPFGSEGPEVRAVDREEVRAEFYAAYPADGENEQKRAASLRQAFHRGEAALRDTGFICTRSQGEVTMVWLAKDIAGNPLHAPHPSDRDFKGA